MQPLDLYLTNPLFVRRFGGGGGCPVRENLGCKPLGMVLECSWKSKQERELCVSDSTWIERPIVHIKLTNTNLPGT